MKIFILLLVVALYCCFLFQTSNAQSASSNITCFGIPADNSTVCSGNGNCTLQDVCSCNSNFTGDSCELLNAPVCPDVRCEALVCCPTVTFPNNCYDPSQMACTTDGLVWRCAGIPSNNPDVCNGNGKCLTLNTCNCTAGFSGANCEISPNSSSPAPAHSSPAPVHSSPAPVHLSPAPVHSSPAPIVSPKPSPKTSSPAPNITCFGVAQNSPNVCSGNGTCVGQDVCSCNFGFIGNNCQENGTSCFGLLKNDTNVCSGHGICVADDTCYCKPNFVTANCGCAVQLDTCPPIKNSCRNCAATDLCCKDLTLGPTCYSSITHRCVRNEVLCGIHDDACGTVCFNPVMYTCNNNISLVLITNMTERQALFNQIYGTAVGSDSSIHSPSLMLIMIVGWIMLIALV